MNTKNKLLNLIADLVEMLIEYGADENSIVEMLNGYGVEKQKNKGFYSLIISNEDTDND